MVVVLSLDSFLLKENKGVIWKMRNTNTFRAAAAATETVAEVRMLENQQVSSF